MSRTILAGLLAFALGCGSEPSPSEPPNPDPQPTPPPSPAAPKTVTEPPAAKPPRQPGEPPRPDDAPYVTGSVTVRGAAPGAVLRVGYFGSLGPDVFVFGSTEAELAPSRSSRSETDKPRVSTLVAGDGRGAPSKYDHSKLTPGRYLVYAELKHGPVAWKWVTVAAGGTATVDLTLDAAQTGALEVGVPLEVVGSVQLVPADEPGRPPLGAALFTAITWHFDLQADVIARKAVFKGLAPGRYEVRSSGHSRVVEIVAGKIAECDLERRPEPKKEPDPKPKG